MDEPKDLRYTESHEWVRLEEDVATVGITDFAQSQLSDLTYVELPSVGDAVGTQDEVAVVESVKAASDVYAPVAGTVEEVNEALVVNPELINSDPYGEGWLFRIKMDNPADVEGLLDADQYEELIPSDSED
jgi:glycine cleavage system H protein